MASTSFGDHRVWCGWCQSGYATLDPGQAGPAFEVCLRTRKAGDAAVSCRIYASINLASVFPAGQQDRTFTVR